VALVLLGKDLDEQDFNGIYLGKTWIQNVGDIDF
jgi:hypothetical protein